jgi:Sulfotransferase family
MQNFFILGCPRSGTTMLQQALNRHSRIVIPPETKFFFSFLGHSRRRQLNHLERLNRDLQIQLPVPRRRIKTDTEARDFFELIARLYLERLGRTDALYFGEKTPEHTGRLWKITRVVPEAKIIFIYRDGRDVALSLTKVPWMHKDLYVNFTIWLYYYRILCRARRDPNLDLLCVKYEELATNPALELRKILDFLGLAYEPAVAEEYGNSEGIPPREYSWKARALERITPDRIGLWRQELPVNQINALEGLGQSSLESLGYPLTTGGQTRLPLAFYATLCWKLFLLALRLPWASLLTELLHGWMHARLPTASRGSPNHFNGSIDVREAATMSENLI